MKIYIGVIIIFILLPAIIFFKFFGNCNTRCVENAGYFTEWGNVYYQPKGTFEGDEIKLEEVDSGSLEILDDIYAKDKNHVYFRGVIIEGVDLETMEFLGYRFLKDKNHVYYGEKIMKDADLKTFQIVAGHYAKDKNHVYMGMALGVVIVEGADPETFEILDKNTFIADYSRDKNYAYFRGKKIPESHGPSFALLENDYSIDKNHVYHLDYLPEDEYKYQVRIVKNANPETFVP